MTNKNLNTYFIFLFLVSFFFCNYVEGNKNSSDPGGTSVITNQWGGDVVFEPEDSLVFMEVIQWARNKNLPQEKLSAIVVDVARWFDGKPYVAHTLEQEGVEQLVVNLREFDCTTFVENVLAISFCIKGGEFSFSDYQRHLKKIRYRDGVIDQYTSRLHYFSDWLIDNQRKGLIELVSNKFGDKSFNPEVSFMSKNADKYAKLSENDFFVMRMADIESHVSRYELKYVSGQMIARVQDRVENGDIIAFSTRIKGLDVSHVGFAFHTVNGLHFIHASTNGNVVKISEKGIVDYVNKRKNCNGILVARPLLN